MLGSFLLLVRTNIKWIPYFHKETTKIIILFSTCFDTIKFISNISDRNELVEAIKTKIPTIQFNFEKILHNSTFHLLF